VFRLWSEESESKRAYRMSSTERLPFTQGLPSAGRDAYHGVKHNREGEFERGTLRYAFEAVSACIALLVAQFGPTALNVELSSLVGLSSPDWPVSDMYLSGLASTDWTPVNHPDL
jgi:hypothetical protein